MDRIETRTQLVEYICEHSTRPAIQRACHEGKVFVAGGFSQIPPSSKPGWIVIVTSRFGRIWNVAVTPNEEKRTFDVRVLKTIPWGQYIDSVFVAEYSIYAGDDPRASLFHKLAHLLCEKRSGSAAKSNSAANPANENKPGDPQL